MICYSNLTKALKREVGPKLQIFIIGEAHVNYDDKVGRW